MQIKGKSLELVDFYCHYHTSIIYNVHQISGECLLCQNDQKRAGWEMGWEGSGHVFFHFRGIFQVLLAIQSPGHGLVAEGKVGSLKSEQE